MKRVVCAVKDNAILSFGQPFFVPHVGAATRAFVDDAKRDDQPVKAHPADFDLYVLGAFDDESGSFECSVPQLVLRGVDAVGGL